MKQPELGIKIAELRIQNSMTQKELAELCNVDIRTIQRIESGDVIPRMYTLRLLATALGSELNQYKGKTEINSKQFSAGMKSSFAAGIIFSINVVPVVFYLITKSLNPFAHILSMIIYILSSVIFFRGFYLLGRQSGNALLTVSALITTIVLPLINLTELLKTYLLKPVYQPGLFISSTIFTLLCLTAIVFGIGLLNQGKRKNGRYSLNLFSITGTMTIIQSILFLSLNFTLVSIGLVISIVSDVLLTIILFREYKDREKGLIDGARGVSLAW
jgi:DNA-binding XRE family transcriptional regulator